MSPEDQCCASVEWEFPLPKRHQHSLGLCVTASCATLREVQLSQHRVGLWWVQACICPVSTSSFVSCQPHLSHKRLPSIFWNRCESQRVSPCPGLTLLSYTVWTHPDICPPVLPREGARPRYYLYHSHWLPQAGKHS